jgi:putative FmdB family regulatory protein
MPIYEYKCAECGHQDEHLQKVSEQPMSVCPSCGKPAYKKLLSAAGFQLKGSGWYATDFRNKGAQPADKKSAEKSAGGGETKSESKSDAKSDSKSDAKTDSKPASKPAVTTDWHNSATARREPGFLFLTS